MKTSRRRIAGRSLTRVAVVGLAFAGATGGPSALASGNATLSTANSPRGAAIEHATDPGATDGDDGFVFSDLPTLTTGNNPRGVAIEQAHHHGPR
jgi:hypothetical protein